MIKYVRYDFCIELSRLVPSTRAARGASLPPPARAIEVKEVQLPKRWHT